MRATRAAGGAADDEEHPAIEPAPDHGPVPSDVLPAPARRWALFLDLDGTLADIEAHPDEVRVPAELIDVLSDLRELLDGALAVVSGRSIADIDRILGPLVLPAAGLHGLDRRDADGTRHRDVPDAEAMDAMRTGMQALTRGDDGVWLEDKGDALALHYRGAPEQGESLRAAVREGVAAHSSLTLLDGKMVLEVKPEGAHKGAAVAAFMGERPFAGRDPVFAGDDVTDEDGFREVLGRGGVAFKVGEGETLADHRLADAAAFRRWLGRLRAHWRDETGRG